MSENQSKIGILRDPKIDINKECILHPWGSKATLLNMSLSGALLVCENFPADFFTTGEGGVEVDNFKIPGKFVRLDKLNVAIEFNKIEGELSHKIQSYIDNN